MKFRKSPSIDSSDDDHISLADQLIRAYFSYEDFVGSSYYKHCRLYKYHSILKKSLIDPTKLIYPSVGATGGENNTTEVAGIDSRSRDRSSIDSEQERAANLKENVPINPKVLRKVLQGIKEYNFSLSILTPQTQLMQANVT